MSGRVLREALIPNRQPDGSASYEIRGGDGLWTPVIEFATNGDLAISYGVQFGESIKIGELVIASFLITTNSFVHTTASGALQISGLPHPIHATGFDSGKQGSAVFAGITLANYTNFIFEAITYGTKLRMVASGSAQIQQLVLASHMPTGGTVYLAGTVMYITRT